jgi:hypothetical protein
MPTSEIWLSQPRLLTFGGYKKGAGTFLLRSRLFHMHNFPFYLVFVLILWLAAFVLYIKVTPYSEFHLAYEDNSAAALSLLGPPTVLRYPCSAS